jgi:RNA polymerase sigma factor (sigma-70 family)
MLDEDQAIAVLGRKTNLFQPRTEEATDTDGLEWLDDVYRYAFARLGSREDAEDATMEVFLAANARPDRIRSASDPRLYLIGIARRKVVDVIRRRRRDWGAPQVGLQESDSGVEDRQVVGDALGKLPAIQREVLILKYVHELSVLEISQGPRGL